MSEYIYRDNKGRLKSKSDKQVMLEGAAYILVDMIIALLMVLIFK